MKYEIYIYEEAKTASFYKKAIAEYEKRLSRYCKISCRFIKKEKEWEKLLTEAETAGDACLVLPGPGLRIIGRLQRGNRPDGAVRSGEKTLFYTGNSLHCPGKE